MTSKTHGPHRRNDKPEYQECTCKIDKSLKRGMFNKFESCKICVAGYQCDNSDFDFCIAEHNELSVIKIYSDEGRDDCQQLKPKGTEASFGTTVITVTILFIISIIFNELVVQKENCVVEEIKEVELRSRCGKFIYNRTYNSIGLNQVSQLYFRQDKLP